MLVKGFQGPKTLSSWRVRGGEAFWDAEACEAQLSKVQGALRGAPQDAKASGELNVPQGHLSFLTWEVFKLNENNIIKRLSIPENILSRKTKFLYIALHICITYFFLDLVYAGFGRGGIATLLYRPI